MLSGQQAATAAISSLLRMRVSCTEIQEALARTATKKSKGFSDASSRDANEILEELSLIQVNGDKSELSKPSGKLDFPQFTVRL